MLVLYILCVEMWLECLLDMIQRYAAGWYLVTVWQLLLGGSKSRATLSVRPPTRDLSDTFLCSVVLRGYCRRRQAYRSVFRLLYCSSNVQKGRPSKSALPVSDRQISHYLGVDHVSVHSKWHLIPSNGCSRLHECDGHTDHTVVTCCNSWHLDPFK